MSTEDVDDTGGDWKTCPKCGEYYPSISSCINCSPREPLLIEGYVRYDAEKLINNLCAERDGWKARAEKAEAELASLKGGDVYRGGLGYLHALLVDAESKARHMLGAIDKGEACHHEGVPIVAPSSDG